MDSRDEYLLRKDSYDKDHSYYVYIHYRKNTDIPFYIGKGYRGRGWRYERNPEWFVRISEDNWVFDVKIFEENLSESEAFKLEKQLILEYGEKYDLANKKENPNFQPQCLEYQEFCKNRQAIAIAARVKAGLYTGRSVGSVETPENFLLKPKNKKIIDHLVNTDSRVSHIASSVGCSRNVVMKVENLLVKQGIIKKIKRGRPGDTRRAHLQEFLSKPKPKRILELINQNMLPADILKKIRKEFGSGTHGLINKVWNEANTQGVAVDNVYLCNPNIKLIRNKKGQRILELLQQNVKGTKIKKIIKKEFGSSSNYKQINKIENIIDSSHRTKLEEFASFTNENEKTPPD